MTTNDRMCHRHKIWVENNDHRPNTVPYGTELYIISIFSTYIKSLRDKNTVIFWRNLGLNLMSDIFSNL
jgi:hypothetical protein